MPCSRGCILHISKVEVPGMSSEEVALGLLKAEFFVLQVVHLVMVGSS